MRDQELDLLLPRWLADGPLLAPESIVDAAIRHAQMHPRSRFSRITAWRQGVINDHAVGRRVARPAFALSWTIVVLATLAVLALGAIVVGTRPPTPPRTLEGSWVQAEAPMLLTAVTPGPGGFVGLGLRGYGHYAFYSSDGLNWSQATIDGLADALARTRTGYVVVGHLWTSDRQTFDYASPVAWVSSDGRTWTRSSIPLAEGLVGGVREVAARDGQLLALGWEATAVGERERAAAWISHDGISWQTVLDYAGGPLASLTVGGPGFVAVNWQEGTIWTSSDGVDWQSAAFPSIPVPIGGHRLASSPDGTLVAATPTGFAWSTDGIRWSVVDGDAALVQVDPDPGYSDAGPTLVEIADLTWTEAGFVAVGNQITRSATGSGSIVRSLPRIWYSPDGRNWTRVPFDTAPHAQLRGVHAAGSTLLISGWDEGYLLWSLPEGATGG